MSNMFKEKGYEVVKGFLEPGFIEFIHEYVYTKIRGGTDAHVAYGDMQSPNSFALYGDALMDTILSMSCKMMSDISGKNLLPTYSYTRLYQQGDELEAHTDRDSCEISATLALGYPDEINPIYFSTKPEEKVLAEGDPEAAEILLEPGDLCLYRGCELTHWRPPIKSNWYLQTFFHYIDANGPYASTCLYDYRPYLGLPDTTRRPPQPTQ